MTDAKAQLDERIDLYLKCICEIKIRLNEMQTISENTGNSFLRTFSELELIYLHVRKICKFLSLGCASLQSMLIPIESNDGRRRYRADRILNLVSHSYYPRAIIFEGTNLIEKSPQPMDRKSLLKQYNFADNILHVGRIKDVFAQQEKKIEIVSFQDFIVGVRAHLDVHTIHLESEHKMLMVHMMPQDKFPEFSIWSAA